MHSRGRPQASLELLLGGARGEGVVSSLQERSDALFSVICGLASKRAIMRGPGGGARVGGKGGRPARPVAIGCAADRKQRPPR